MLKSYGNNLFSFCILGNNALPDLICAIVLIFYLYYCILLSFDNKKVLVCAYIVDLGDCNDEFGKPSNCWPRNLLLLALVYKFKVVKLSKCIDQNGLHLKSWSGHQAEWQSDVFYQSINNRVKISIKLCKVCFIKNRTILHK